MHLDILLCSIVFYLLRISVFELKGNSNYFVKQEITDIKPSRLAWIQRKHWGQCSRQINWRELMKRDILTFILPNYFTYVDYQTGSKMTPNTQTCVKSLVFKIHTFFIRNLALEWVLSFLWKLAFFSTQFLSGF